VQAQTQDQLGTLDVEVKGSSLVCLPCTKTLLP
jgi:hypothetical protein